MALGGAVMIVFAIAMALGAPAIAALYLPATPENAEALALTVLFLRVAAAFQLFDGLQVIGANALRGLKDARLPMMLAGGSYWLVGFPLTLWFGFGLDWQGLGIWLGLACSSWRWLRSPCCYASRIWPLQSNTFYVADFLIGTIHPRCGCSRLQLKRPRDRIERR